MASEKISSSIGPIHLQSKGSIFQPAFFLVYQRVGSTISGSNGSAFPSQPFRIHNSLKMEVVSSGADEDLEEDSSWSPGVPEALFRLQRTKLRCKKKVDLSFFQKDKLVCVCVCFLTAHLGWSCWNQVFSNRGDEYQSNIVYYEWSAEKKVWSQRPTDNCQGESSMI